MKKIDILIRDKIIMGIIALLLGVLLISTVFCTFLEDRKNLSTSESDNSDLVRVGFYPGRLYGENSDYVFCFDEYLAYIGATDVERYIYTNETGTNFELKFRYDEMDWTLKTTEFRMSDEYSWSMYTQIEAKDGGVRFGVPNQNSGTHICDSSSPFKIDWDAFNIFHAATDQNSVLTKGLRSEVDESNCPFRGLGFVHYEAWEDGEIIWHDDDIGIHTAENGLDLHY